MGTFYKTFFLLSLFLGLSVSAEGTLRWAADSESGAPYIFRNPDNPKELIGFEVDLAEALAGELGLKAEFVQNQWEGLIPGLKRRDYDIAMNGLEITPEHEQEINFSKPYYLTHEELTVHRNNMEIHSLKDCKGKKVGTLKFSLAQSILDAEGGIHVNNYESEVNAYGDLIHGRIDAVLMDFPVALYLGRSQSHLKVAGGPIGQMGYGVGIRKEDKAFLGQINEALDKLTRSGKLREILERWNLWNPSMAAYLGDLNPSNTPHDKYDSYLKAIGAKKTWTDQMWQYVGYLPLLGKGALTTLQISIIAMFFAVCWGLVVCVLRIYGGGLFSSLATFYVEFIRGTPLLIQLTFIFYGLPSLGIKLSPLWAAIVGLGMNYAAYEAENYRAGILSVHKGQFEAAFALGFSRLQALRYVVLPQALRCVIPPVTNDFISLLKDSSLVSVITMVELTKVYGQLAIMQYDYLGVGALTAAMYFLIGLPFVWIARKAESHFSFERKKANFGLSQRKEIKVAYT